MWGINRDAKVSGAPRDLPAGGVPQLEEQILQDVQNLQTTVNNQANSLAVLQQLSGHCTDGATKTRLLFTFVTAVAGFDTSLAISNTSADPFGTTPSAGTCTLNFFGFNAPAIPFTTPNVPAGTTNINLTSPPAKRVVASIVGEVQPTGSPSRPVSGSAVAGSVPNSVSMLLTVGLDPGGPKFSTTYFVRVDFSLNDLKGKMVCQVASGAPRGCDQGQFDWTPVTCP